MINNIQNPNRKVGVFVFLSIVLDYYQSKILKTKRLILYLRLSK